MALLSIILSAILLIVCVGVVIKQGADCILKTTLLNTACCGALIMMAILMLYDTTNHSALTSNSEKVLSVRDLMEDDETVIYVDENGNYFYLVSNDWNICHPKEKKYIPTEKVEEYLEHYNEIQKIDLFGKGEEK